MNSTQNNALNAMFEEEEETRKFNEWVNNEVSFYNDMNDDEKQQLRSDYNQANLWKQTYKDTMTQAINHSGSGLDYSTDIDKVGERMENASNKLNQTLSGFSEKYGNVRNR